MAQEFESDFITERNQRQISQEADAFAAALDRRHLVDEFETFMERVESQGCDVGAAAMALAQNQGDYALAAQQLQLR